MTRKSVPVTVRRFLFSPWQALAISNKQLYLGPDRKSGYQKIQTSHQHRKHQTRIPGSDPKPRLVYLGRPARQKSQPSLRSPTHSAPKPKPSHSLDPKPTTSTIPATRWFSPLFSTHRSGPDLVTHSSVCFLKPQFLIYAAIRKRERLGISIILTSNHRLSIVPPPSRLVHTAFLDWENTHTHLHLHTDIS
ncbi:uncharacterized protein LY79DRAFT_541526 [Colletotrichum navitas]|uniref:Uncharacterized protein n=1 Tax=Colletotrichum navitas TaxID=681940 RepID=A0AAD8VAF9_9PEZI|nr:uncharacterized protein LY79DRAFT_541526 [Colletotrichum navitas]KAK1597395.1 hypothetical protein LY79DRAFT_541526 [Colletotrichum navitas]